MTAPVRIEASAWGDLRFATLARLCGFADAEHALIKVAKIWSWQTEHYRPDAPTYVVDPELVESALGPGGAGHMVRARLAEEGPDGLRIRGSEGRIEWLWKNRQASARGGEATKRKHKNKAEPPGPVTAQPEPQPTPRPEIGPLTPAPDLPRSEEALSPARAIPPDQRRELRDETWSRVNAERAKYPGARQLSIHDPGYSELAARVAESGAEARANVEHVLAIAFAEAEAKGTPQYLSGSMFELRSWSKKLALRVEDVTRRAGPHSNSSVFDGVADAVRELERRTH